MSRYHALSDSYDSFMTAADYQRRTKHLIQQFRCGSIPVRTVLDLGCGTGTIACLLSERGYRVWAVDSSEDMLTQAAKKAETLARPPQFLHQKMQRLQLLQPVDAAFSTLDALNYLTRERELQETFQRVYRSLLSGGCFLFDVNTPDKFRRMDGHAYWEEAKDSCCAWRVFYNRQTRIGTYQVDLFQRRCDGAWNRSFEEHRERAWTIRELKKYLVTAGFRKIEVRGAHSSPNRWYFQCQKE